MAAAAAERLAGRIAEAQAEQRHGPRRADRWRRRHRHAAGAAHASAGSTAIDWRAVDLWWGDERFLPYGHPERNDTQAREALLDHVDLDWSLVHPMGAPDGPDGDDPDAAAERYAAELAGCRRAARCRRSTC